LNSTPGILYLYFMDQEKLHFIQITFPQLLNNLEPGAQAKWGKMNAQQMVEHVADFFGLSVNKIQFDLVTPEEHLPKYMAFLYSDKEFRENTKAPEGVMPEEPAPERYAGLPEAVTALKTEVNDFIVYFSEDPAKKTTHPVFGSLDYNEWVLLHYKHVQHHLKQFGIL